MTRPASLRPDWRGWRTDVLQRVNRPVVVAGLACAGAGMAFGLVHPGSEEFEAATVIGRASLWLVVVAASVVALSIAMVAVVRGASPWRVYPLAAVVVALVATGTALALHPYAWIVVTPAPRFPSIVASNLGILFLLLCAPAVLYVHASSTAHHERLLRALDTERVADAERLAQQRLQTELATVDHDLVLRAMRLALAVRAREPARSDALLVAATTYLRAAQQRGSSEPEGVESALEHLEQACASVSGEAGARVSA